MVESTITLDLGLGKPLGHLAKSICQLVEEFREPANQLAGLAADQLAWWRFRNIASKARRARELARDQGISERDLPPSLMVPWMLSASVVDDPDLSEMWAQLLASAAADIRHGHPAYLKTLERLGAEDARFLTSIVQNWTPKWRGHLLRLEAPFEPNHEEATRLAAVGILDVGISFCDDPPDPDGPGEYRGISHHIRAFGWQFVGAVLPKLDADLERKYPGSRKK